MMNWSVLGEKQPVATKMLQNSIQKNRIAHAYLFHGPRGTGKREASLLFAMRYFCERPQENEEPCGECVACKRIQSGNHPDVHWLSQMANPSKKNKLSFCKKNLPIRVLSPIQRFILLKKQIK